MRPSLTPNLLSLGEQTTLPQIVVRTKGKQTRYHASVNGYIHGPVCRVNGARVVPLYLLSLVAMAGDGGKLQGIWSALASEPPQDVSIDGLGTVVLAHHDPHLESLEYRLHWNYTQQPVRERTPLLHAVIESRMLTLVDPLAGAAPLRREPKPSQQTTARKGRSERVVQLATAKKELGAWQEQVHREQHPLFLLMTPGGVAPQHLPEESEARFTARRTQTVEAFLAQQHVAFLDRRVPWPLSPQWGDFLWQRGWALQENVPLTSWFYEAVQRGEEDEGLPEVEGDEAHTRLPLFSDAWLCRPDVLRVYADVRAALRNGRIPSLGEAATAVSPHETSAMLV